MLEETQNKLLDEIMTGRGDKRREENANPKPAQAKAKTTSWAQQGHSRYTPNEPIPKAPPPKANSSPEADHEPKGRRGRPPKYSPEAEPKSTPASSSRDTPYAKAQAKAAANAGPDPEETRSKAIPVKKTKPKPKHETEKVVFGNYDEWFEKSLGFLMDQLSVRRLNYDIYMPIPEFLKPKPPKVKKPKKQYKPEIIEMLLKFDGKI
jgi:hypothetical protein